MIEAIAVSKMFGDIKAVDQVTLTIRPAQVFGLLGTNGAGKSTFLRMISGILKPDKGNIKVEDKQVYENVDVKSKFFYISDDQYFFPNATPRDMKHYYSTFYPNFDSKRFDHILDGFSLASSRKINTFSKGMKRQLSIILGLCSGTKYLICDEAFDGLDPVMRQTVKSLLAEGMEERGLTPIIASHNLRELEDICDCVGLLHKGGMLLERDLEDMKCGIHKIQCVLPENIGREHLDTMDILSIQQRGSLITFTARGQKEALINQINILNPVFSEVLPLSLEEIFISETEVVGYDIKSLVL